LDLSPNFTTPLLIRGEELRVLGSTAACLPARKGLAVEEFYLYSLTSRGDIQQLYADVWAMDLGHWPADSKALVNKGARAPRANDEDCRVWSDQPLFDKYVSALAKPRRLKCSGVGHTAHAMPRS